MGSLAFKSYPIVGACGLDCGLCPRHHTNGPSRCPGCAAKTYIGPGCALQRCCVKNHGLECCAECPDTGGGCRLLDRVIKASTSGDSFISYLTVPDNLNLIREGGLPEFARREDDRVAFLEALIENHDDGRSKGFYCLAVQRLPIDELRQVFARLSVKLSEQEEVKLRAAMLRNAFNELASGKGLTLKLRRSG